jgi:D-alanyl-lipoteichoic acid acyltransferase DltB (MBOAT superfamily)
VLFPTATFAIFFLLVLPASWLLMRNGPRWRAFMLAASYLFYGWWDWRFCFLLAASTIVNQVFAVAVHRARDGSGRKLLLAADVVFNLGVLFLFKYYDFFAASFQNGLADVGVHVSPGLVGAILPVGISFFTFQALSYVIDVYRRDFTPTSLSKFAVFLSFFPHVVAGPIVRAREFVPQLRTPRDPRRVDASRAFFLIGSGLFLKVVIATYLADEIVDDVFGTPDRYSALDVLVGVYAYAVQIFADFCGYTNIAIGVALLLGFRFPQNFDNPYTALSPRDFWRRWHMTLSRWLRDYLYIPLGGNRHGNLVTYRNLMIVMILGGLWHGAGWTFAIWGALWGVALVGEHWWEERRRARGPVPARGPSVRGRAWRRLATFNLVCLGWVFFRAASVDDAFSVLGRIVTGWGQSPELVSGGVLLAIAVGIGGQYVPTDAFDRLMVVFSRLSPVAQGAALALALTVIGALGPEGVAPFIYFQF